MYNFSYITYKPVVVLFY